MTTPHGMARASEAEIEVGLQKLSGWERVGAEIKKEYRFFDFKEAVAFVGRVTYRSGTPIAAAHTQNAMAQLAGNQCIPAMIGVVATT